MGKSYDIPVITIHVSGGVVQDVNIPKDTNAKVRVKDYDCDVEPDSEETKEQIRLNEALANAEYSEKLIGWLELDNGYMFFKDQETGKKTADLLLRS